MPKWPCRGSTILPIQVWNINHVDGPFHFRGVKLSSLSLSPDRSPLLCAVESGSWDLVVSFKSGYIFLNISCFKVAVLSQSDCDFNSKNEEGQTALHRAAIKGSSTRRALPAEMLGHVGLMDLLIKKNLSIDAIDVNGWTSLMHAVNHISLLSTIS